MFNGNVKSATSRLHSADTCFNSSVDVNQSILLTDQNTIKKVNGEVEQISLKSLCCSLNILLPLKTRFVRESRCYLQVLVALQENKY